MVINLTGGAVFSYNSKEDTPNAPNEPRDLLCRRFQPLVSYLIFLYGVHDTRYLQCPYSSVILTPWGPNVKSTPWLVEMRSIMTPLSFFMVLVPAPPPTAIPTATAA